MLGFGEAYIEGETCYGDLVTASVVSSDLPAPYINSDGSFTVDINNVGYVLKSDTFKVSDTSCKVRISAGAGSGAGSEYYVTFYKDGIIDTKIQTVTYYTGGVYEYTFTGLSTSAKYYLKFDSNHTKLNCPGTISNYVAID